MWFLPIEEGLESYGGLPEDVVVSFAREEKVDGRAPGDPGGRVIVTTNTTISHSYSQTKIVGGTQEALSYRGVDRIAQTTTQTSTFYNSEGKQLYSATMSQSVSVTVDESGKASSPLLTTSGATTCGATSKPCNAMNCG